MQQIKKDIFWTGYIDWHMRLFHGYATPHGSTYNAYLILDDKPTLIDTVKHYGFDEMLSRVREVIDPAKIQYIISNHTEMDHSGSIDQLLSFCPRAEVVCSPHGAEGLSRHFKKNWKMKVVNTGDTLDIGKRKLKFVLMPMLHWPDSMATYSEFDKILFPNDAFGQHYASAQRFADELGLDVVFQEAAKYYANIILPFGSQVLKALEAIKALPLDMICPSHGLIWRRAEDIKRLMGFYQKWANHETENRAVIVYDTMWHSTEQMANRLYELIDKENIPVTLMNTQLSHISDIVTEILSAKVVLFGTPMLNNHMLPSMASLVMYLKGLRPQKRYAATFGSYGWATAGFKELEESVKEAGFELMSEGRYIKYIPDESELNQLQSLAAGIKEKFAQGVS